jgi:hypothetical protein
VKFSSYRPSFQFCLSMSPFCSLASGVTKCWNPEIQLPGSFAVCLCTYYKRTRDTRVWTRRLPPKEAEGGRRRPKEAEGGRRRPKEAEGGRRRPKAEGGRRRPKEAEGGRRTKEE